MQGPHRFWIINRNSSKSHLKTRKRANMLNRRLLSQNICQLSHLLLISMFLKLNQLCAILYLSEQLKTQYQFSIIENIAMEVQSSVSAFFSPINQTTSHYLRNKAVIYSGPCSVDPQGSTNHTLKMIGSKLVLESPTSTPLIAELTFDLKFEILYQTEKNVSSPKLGVKFYDESQRQLKIFFSATTVEHWCQLLGKRINQKGFHEMFKPIRKLGKGNFATVYEAQRMTDKVKFAVKAFSKQACYSQKNGKESLINQLTILRQLNKLPQDNILKLEGVFESENSIYVILELLTGKTLFQVIEDRKGCFSQAEIKTLMTGLLKGLAHMHKERIMHRDLKPENIMLRGNSIQPVIVDFGLGAYCDQKQYLYFRCGTPGYVAPEIVCLQRCGHIEPACDVFSLGAIFYVLLCRRPLFGGTKYEQVYENNKEFKIKFEGDHFKSVPATGKQLLKEMLVLEPSKRINVLKALDHCYFCEQTDEDEEYKISSPVLTEISVSFIDEKKRRGFLCY